MDQLGDTFIALPTHDSRVGIGCLYGCLLAGRHARLPQHYASSLLPKSFNVLWANAVASGLPYFAMMHSDIYPQPGWLDLLIDELKSNKADLVSTVIAIKNDGGDTSTAAYCDGKIHRLTLSQAASLPGTFSKADVHEVLGCDGPLLVNTGLFVADLRKPWSREVYFEITSSIEWHGDDVIVDTQPEDWNLSRKLDSIGCRVMATTKVQANHIGEKSYGNQG